jgi:putative intracellular protease/amidase
MSDTNLTGMETGKATPVILMPLPDYDFDPTEAAIPWQVCASRGWKVVISTEHGEIAQADLHKLKGPLPGLLSASAEAQEAYRKMTQDPAYQHPIPYAEIDPAHYDALLLPGGDGLRVRQYLESPLLQSKVLQIWQQGKLIGAICHGVLVLARTIDPQTGHSVLYSHKVTATPKSLDRLAYRIDHTVLKRGYIMYSRCVADEVQACLEHPEDFSKGPGVMTPYVLSDGNLITSRWYLEAEQFAGRFADELQKRSA